VISFSPEEDSQCATMSFVARLSEIYAQMTFDGRPSSLEGSGIYCLHVDYPGTWHLVGVWEFPDDDCII
jgi:hypothetical protein